LEHVYGSYLCIGPALEEGFYYDSYTGKLPIEESDYKAIEEAAMKVAKANLPYQRLTLNKSESLELFKHNPFKIQLITNKVPEDGKTTAYRCGDLIDLCMGPHLMHTGLVKSFKVTKNSSCYWLGHADNDSLQRVYGISFLSAEKEMKEYIKRKEEEEKRDHRNIGKQQDLFMFHNLSPGSSFLYPNGAHIYNKLVSFIRKEYLIRGFSEVISPNIFNLKLWKTSGHYKNYKDNMFMLKVENQGFGLKPMNCPGHCLMFDHKARSYKELPIRFADFGVLHRNELSGALSGLTRVRRFQQDDAHIFCTPEQIMDEIVGQLEFLEYCYQIFGFEYELFLSTKPEKALGDHSLWEVAEKALADALDKFKSKSGKEWKINPGDGAFYGPKIDIKLYDALKRQHQCGTIQLDFQLPIRFNLSYRSDEQVKHEDTEKIISEKKDLKKEVYPKDEFEDEEFTWEEQPLKAGYKRPVIIHRAILGSCERLLAILIEHYGGKWPFWLNPKQAMICTVSDNFNAYAEKVYKRLHYEGYQVGMDKAGATLQKKVRNAQIEQYNYILVIGQEEQNTNTVAVRIREGEVIGKFTIDKLIELFKSMEPSMSIAEKTIVDELKSFGEVVLSEVDQYEARLSKDVFLSGEDFGEEDQKIYGEYKDKEICREKHPNFFKWRKYVAKFI
jgi:threonyl-tRNA synthetase